MEKEEGMEALSEGKERQHKEMYEGGDSEGGSKEQRVEERKVEVRRVFPLACLSADVKRK